MTSRAEPRHFALGRPNYQAILLIRRTQVGSGPPRHTPPHPAQSSSTDKHVGLQSVNASKSMD